MKQTPRIFQNVGNYFRQIDANRLLCWLLAAWWGLNLLQASFTELANDEAYYWIFANNLDWGYFDHPPLTALLVWMGNFIGSELGVRFFFLLLQPIYLYMLWAMIRPAKATRSDAALFFVIAAAMPIMQLYGMVAVPDGPLMLTTALFLLFFKRFTERNGFWDAVLMGLSIGLMAYAKYQGALVVLCALAVNSRLFKNPKLYLGGVIALLVMAPHLWWQYNHDWCSFHYHLIGRSGYFKWSNVSEYILNYVAVFNPLFFIFFIRNWRTGRTRTAFDRALYGIVAGFTLIFLLACLKGRTQPQWLIPICFGLITILFRAAHSSERINRFIRIAGWITIGLFVLVRVELMFNPLGIRFEVFNNRTSYAQIAEIADGRPVVFGGSYAVASKYIFYTGGSAYSQPNINYRTSQWQYIDTDSEMANREVVRECWRETADSSIRLDNGKEFSYFIDHCFKPTRKVSIEMPYQKLPQQVTAGELLSREIKITNPYDYQITLSPDSLSVNFVWGRNKEQFHEYPILDSTLVVPAHTSMWLPIEIAVPNLEPKEYRTGFVIHQPRTGYWFASKEYKTEIAQQKR